MTERRGASSETEDWELLDAPEEPHTSPSFPRGSRFYFEFTLQFGGPQYAQTRQLVDTENPLLELPDASIDNQEQCKLFDKMPPELRLRIYEETLFVGLPEVRLKWIDAGSSGEKEKKPPSVLSILATCRRICFEAEPIFYTINHLLYQVDSSHPDMGFFEMSSPRRRHAIRQLTLSVSSAGQALSLIEELLHVPNLRKLRLVRRQSIRYTDVGSWAVLAGQMKKALEALTHLTELEIVTPEIADLNDDELQRQRRLGQIDTMLQEVTAKSFPL